VISLILAKIYGIILENKISLWLEIHGKRAKGQARPGLGDIIQLWTILLPLRSLQRSSTILTPIFFVVLLTLEKLDMVPKKNLWNRLEEIKVPLKLRDAAIRMYENIIAKFKNSEG
jgi:hypothetical protein